MRTIAMEYLEEGMTLSSQKAIINFLKARFMILPPIVEERIKQVTNTAVLDEAVRQAALVENVEQFIAWLETQ